MQGKNQDVEKGDSVTSLRESFHSKSVTDSGAAEGSRVYSGNADENSDDHTKFQWKTEEQNALYFLAYTFSWESFLPFNVYDGVFEERYRIDIYQLIVAYIFFGNPVVFLQTFIGQYTKRGAMILGEMLPLLNGVSYLIIVNMLVSAITNLRVATISLSYLFYALTNLPVPPWMICFEGDLRFACVGLKEMDLCTTCTSPDAENAGPCLYHGYVNLSSFLFLRFRVTKLFNTKNLYEPFSNLSIHLALLLIALFFSLGRNLKVLQRPMTFWNIYNVVILVTLIGVTSINHRVGQGLYTFFRFYGLPNYANILQTLKNVIVFLKLSEGGHFLFGVFTPVTVNTGTRSAFFCTLHFLILCLFNIFTFLLMETLQCTLNIKDLHAHVMNHDVLLYAFYAQAMGYFASSPLWSALYFSLLFGISFQCLLLQIMIMEHTLSISVLKPDYFWYTRLLILILLTFGVLYMITPVGTLIGAVFFGIYGFVRVLIIGIFFVALVLYGFQRLSDDMHFLLRRPPLKYYRISWILSAFVAAASALLFFTELNLVLHVFVMEFLLIATATILLLGLAIKFVVQLKAKDLTSLLRPSENYGAPDPEKRIERKLFNPRYEVHFRRRVDKCNHRCLLGSVTVKKTLENELALVSNVLAEIEDQSTDRSLRRDLVEGLRSHRTLMSNFLSKITQSIQKGST